MAIVNFASEETQALFVSPEAACEFFNRLKAGIAAGGLQMLVCKDDAVVVTDLETVKGEVYDKLAQRLLSDPARLTQLEQQLSASTTDWDLDEE